MKGWPSHLLWTASPFILQIGVFGFLCAINWDYEKKMISTLGGASNWTEAHLGPILLMVAGAQACMASLTLLIARLCLPKKNEGSYMIVCLTLVAVFFMFPSMFIIVLGPAAITMKEQMTTVPR
jgi:hypothetical protein